MCFVYRMVTDLLLGLLLPLFFLEDDLSAFKILLLDPATFLFFLLALLLPPLSMASPRIPGRERRSLGFDFFGERSCCCCCCCASWAAKSCCCCCCCCCCSSWAARSCCFCCCCCAMAAPAVCDATAGWPPTTVVAAAAVLLDRLSCCCRCCCCC